MCLLIVLKWHVLNLTDIITFYDVLFLCFATVRTHKLLTLCLLTTGWRYSCPVPFHICKNNMLFEGLKNFMFRWPCNVIYPCTVIKPSRCTNSQIIFGIKLYMFRTVPLSVIRNFSLYTQQWYMSCRFADSLRAGSGRKVLILQAVNKPVWHIPLLCVQWKIPDDGQRNCPKHVEFYSKNKFEN